MKDDDFDLVTRWLTAIAHLTAARSTSAHYDPVLEEIAAEREKRKLPPLDGGLYSAGPK